MRENREKHKLKCMLSWLIYFDFFIAFRILYSACVQYVCVWNVVSSVIIVKEAGVLQLCMYECIM